MSTQRIAPLKTLLLICCAAALPMPIATAQETVLPERVFGFAGIRHAIFSPDGNKFLIVHGSVATLWDAATGAQLRTFDQRQLFLSVTTIRNAVC